MFRRRSAFTLMEVLVVLALFVVVAGLGFQYLQADPNRASAIGLAEELAKELQGARDEAIAEQQPVAVAFPTNGGTVLISKGVYVLKGEDAPRIRRSMRFDSGYEDTAVCVGQWATPDTGTLSLRVDGDDFDLAGWLAKSSVTDPVFVFLPSGAVLSTLPSYDGRYGLLVSTRFVLSGSTIQSAHRAETVWVNALGEVLVETGSPTSVIESDLGNTLGAAVPPPLTTPGPDAPVIADVRCEPDFSDGVYDPGVWGGLREDEYATLVVEATDPNGGPLYTAWTGPGQFGSTTEGRMEWDEDAEVWRSTWTWSPPNGPDPPGTTYPLVCRVRDPQGNESTGDSSQSPSFVLSSDAILAVHHSVGSGKHEVLLMTEEGHVTHTIPVIGQSPSPVNLNRDGTSFLVYDSEVGSDSVCFYKANGEKMATIHSGRHASFNAAQNEIVTIHPQGTVPMYITWYEPAYGMTQTILTPAAAPEYPVKFGDAIVANISTGPLSQGMAYFLTTDSDPFNDKVVFDTTSGFNISASFAPDGSWIIYAQGGEIRAVSNPPFTPNPAPPAARVPTTPSTIGGLTNVGTNVVFSPTGDQVLFFRRNGSQQELWRASFDGSASPPILGSPQKVTLKNFSLNSKGLNWFQP